jgi:hypothetical protein
MVVAKQGIRPDETKINAMLETKPPPDVMALRTFIGASVWLSKHVEDYTRMIAPLRAIVNRYPPKMKADISDVWIYEPEALNAFNAVKVTLRSRPLLTLPQFDREFIILVDASGDGYGACLAHIGEERPIAYASTALNKA